MRQFLLCLAREVRIRQEGERPLSKSSLICPISAFAPWNAKHICQEWLKILSSPPGGVDLTGRRLALEPRLNIKSRFNRAGKIECFSKVSYYD